MPHIHDKYDYVIVVYIVRGDTVLLVNHPRYNKWIPVGGHIELDEDPEAALFREIQEETGLKVDILSTKSPVTTKREKSLLTPNYLDVHEANPPHKHIGLIYFAITKDEKVHLSAEHSDIKWFTLAELAEDQYRLSPPVIFYAEQALKTAAQNS
jgi:8-oxo-dGTP pyrophosphatase MutT (NUDIX family)